MRKLLLVSVSLNTLFVAAGLYFFWKRHDIQPTQEYDIEKGKVNRNTFLEKIPIDSNDIVFVGNSLTEQYPLQELFANSHIKNRGIAYSTSRDILERIKKIADAHPKKIFLSAGINDIVFNHSIDSLFTNVKEIITIAKAESAVFVQSVLPTNNVQLNKIIVQHNEKVRQYCTSQNVSYIDLYAAFLEGETIKPSYTTDGIHLTGAAYFEWTEQLKPYVN